MSKPTAPSILVVAPGDPNLPHSGDTGNAADFHKLFNNFSSASLFCFKGHNIQEPPYRLYIKFPKWILSYLIRLASFQGIVYIYNHPRITFFTLLTKRILRRKLKVLPWIGNPDWDSLLGRFVARSSDAILLNNFTLEKFRCRFATLARSSLYVPALIVNFDELDKACGDKIETRAIFGLGKDQKVAGLIGPFHRYNKPSLQYLANNLERFRGVTFLVIGDYNKEDRIDDPRLVYTGYVENFNQVLGALDCVLIPRFVHFNSPMGKMVHSMAVGLPVVTNELEGMPLENGREVLLGTLDDLPKLVSNLFADEELARVIGENGKRFVRSYFSADGVAAELKEFLVSL